MKNLNNFLKPFEDKKVKLTSFFELEYSIDNSLDYRLSRVLFTPDLQEAEDLCKKLNKNNINVHYRVTELILTLNN